MIHKASQIKSFFRENFGSGNNQFFTLLVLFWIGLGWLGLLLTLFGFFYISILTIYVLLGVAGLFYLAISKTVTPHINRHTLLILLLSVAAIAVFARYSTPTIFSGRDQGSLSEAAIRLTQNHQLEFSSPASREFFAIYGPGKALNFPGFNYTQAGELITQFPLGYISWLATFYAFFGLNGLIIANAVTFFIFLLSFYLLARRYLQFSSALIVLLLTLTSFVFSWFFKFTLSENLALALTWFGIFEFILFLKNNNRLFLLASLLSLGLLTFARIEAWGFLAVILIILLFKHRDWKHLLWQVIGKKILLVSLAIVLLYLFNIAINSQFFIALAKGMLKPFTSFGAGLQNSTSFFFSFWYVIKLFFAYALFNYLLLGILAFVYLLKSKKFDLLLPFLIVLPSFIYLLNPSISVDHPWMLRRFVFAIIPVATFYAVWFLDHFLPKRPYFYLVTGLMLATNLLVFVPFLTFSPNQNLLPQVAALDQNFEANDLVLVDPLATGDGWSMLTGPLSFLAGKQAVYFFNPQDLDKIDHKKFNAVYFIIPDNNLDFYAQSGLLPRLTPLKDYQLETQNLQLANIGKKEAFSAAINLPTKQDVTIYGKIYLLKR
ncbi:MAG: hypothetical protein WC238_02510 [Parcubacteria group bacterium]|jgi:hypothetical protein